MLASREAEPSARRDAVMRGEGDDGTSPLMPRIALVALVLTLAACSPSRTASCQLLFDCCHGSADCDPVVDQNDPGACQTQLVVSRGSGMCHDSDGGSTSSDAGVTLRCMTTSDAGASGCTEMSGPSAPMTCPSGTSPVAMCTTVGEVGRCAVSTTDGSMAIVHFYPPTPAASAMSVCSGAGGTYTPG
jgi:hypothetical protein